MRARRMLSMAVPGRVYQALERTPCGSDPIEDL
jgi:hypothetical protein